MLVEETPKVFFHNWTEIPSQNGPRMQNVSITVIGRRTSFGSAVADRSGGWKRSVRIGGWRWLLQTSFLGLFSRRTGGNRANAARGSFVYPPSGGVCPKRSSKTPNQIDSRLYCVFLSLPISGGKNCNTSVTTDPNYEYYDEICKMSATKWSTIPRVEVEGFRLIISAVPRDLSVREELNFVIDMIRR
ncbi:hypothetical protein KSP40_PGU012947 [Platanthera guangdongensis]|uniref:Uncharacterized protein n=1 Tax=Platanthera guangdongensis TaxID=2320717 RepID=A0ABR2MBT7_9ASPA